MACEHRDDVAAHLLGALSPDEALRLDRHMLECDDCARTRRELSIVRTLLDTFEPEDTLGSPPELGDTVVAGMIANGRRSRRHDLRMAMLGAAAAFVLVVGGFLVARATRSDTPTSQDMEVVDPAMAPDAWAVVNLHERVAGTIVDLEVGDLPQQGARYRVQVTGGGAVIADEEFTVDPDGWAQVLLATDRTMTKGDWITVYRVDTPQPVPVLTCECTA